MLVATIALPLASLLGVLAWLLPKNKKSCLGSLSSSALSRIKSWNSHGLTTRRGLPGPMQLPLIGRVHDLDRFRMWKKLKEWADLYGPIYRTSMMGQKFIIISSQKIAEDILLKRGDIYSGRPQIRALNDHKTGPGYVALMDRNATWAQQRKWMHAAMVAAHQQHFHGVIEREVRRWLAVLLIEPAKFHAATREHSGRIASTLVWDDAALGKEYGDSADETLHQISVSGPVVNTVPLLWSIPFACNPWKRYERVRETAQRAAWLSTYRAARARYLGGHLPASTWSHRYLAGLPRRADGELGESAQEEEYASCMLGFQCLVGIITICGPMQFFLMAMALHPEWQRKAQAEIDRVCGGTMPTTADFAHLPTVRACLKETLRWRSGTPLGVPHQAERDDEYMGETITKGTIVMACEWNINRDPETYPDPERYRPDRYLDPAFPTYQEPLSRYPNFREGTGMHTFGWGRRVCLGQHLVDDEMFVTGAGVLWAFNLAKKRCPLTGAELDIDSEATNSHVILETRPFPLDISPRSDERAEQIMAAYAEIRGALKV